MRAIASLVVLITLAIGAWAQDTHGDDAHRIWLMRG